MRIDTTESSPRRTDPAELSPTTIFRLLADGRRRDALSYLSRRVGPTDVDELAAWLAAREGDPSHDRRERIVADLHHCHLPRLLDAGVVRYDPERRTVQRLAVADQLEPYLALSAGEDAS